MNFLTKPFLYGDFFSSPEFYDTFVVSWILVEQKILLLKFLVKTLTCPINI